MVASFSIRSLNVRYTRVTTYHNYKNYRESTRSLKFTRLSATLGGVSLGVVTETVVVRKIAGKSTASGNKNGHELTGVYN